MHRCCLERIQIHIWWQTGDDVVDACGILIDDLFQPPIILPASPPSDAHDPDGAKAPGKPGVNEGFQDPPDGEEWVRNPNGRGNGWRDADGNVWIPTGHGGAAHGGPHWDVQPPRR
jgi:hypothetical protein